MEHTKEPWSVRNEETITIRDSENNQLAILTMIKTRTGGRREADEVESSARRIVACVNACAGVPIEQLELDKVYFIEMLKERNTLKQQRDELLEALKWAIKQMPDPSLPGGYFDGYQIARAAIAKATA